MKIINISLLSFVILFISYQLCFAQTDYYVISSTELKYKNEFGNKVSILVQLRAPKKTIESYIDNNGTCLTYNKTNIEVMKSDSWELVVNPETAFESVIKIDDWGGFVSNTLHNGQLYIDMFEEKNDYDKLFLYYFTYGDCSNECVHLFYYNKISENINKINFNFGKGAIDDFICINRKEGTSLEKSSEYDCEKDDPNCPVNGLKTTEFEQGVVLWFTYFWKYNSIENCFNIYNYSKREY